MGLVDIVVFAVFIAAVVFVGLWKSRKEKDERDAQDFFLARGQVSRGFDEHLDIEITGLVVAKSFRRSHGPWPSAPAAFRTGSRRDEARRPDAEDLRSRCS